MAAAPLIETTMKRRIATFALLISAFAAAPDASAATACGAAADRNPAVSSTAAAERATLCLLNRERRAHGLGRLAANGQLRVAGARHALDMVRRDYFSHTAPGGISFVSRIKDTSYIRPDSGWTVGENLAWGAGRAASPRSIVRQWMNSPGHRANILKPGYRQIGIAIVRGVPVGGAGSGATYATEFGARY